MKSFFQVLGIVTLLLVGLYYIEEMFWKKRSKSESGRRCNKMTWRWEKSDSLGNLKEYP